MTLIPEHGHDSETQQGIPADDAGRDVQSKKCGRRFSDGVERASVGAEGRCTE